MTSRIPSIFGENTKKNKKTFISYLVCGDPSKNDTLIAMKIMADSGVDIIENDKLGRLSVSINGCKERDKYILSYCKSNNIPIQVSMGGGYSPVLRDIIEAHANTFRSVSYTHLTLPTSDLV